MKLKVFLLLLTALFVLPVYGKGNKQLNEQLIQAAESGNFEEVKALIAKGADVNYKKKDNNGVDWTALSYTYYDHNNIKGSLWLLDHGADANAGWLPSPAPAHLRYEQANLKLNQVYKDLMARLSPQ